MNRWYKWCYQIYKLNQVRKNYLMKSWIFFKNVRVQFLRYEIQQFNVHGKNKIFFSKMNSLMMASFQNKITCLWKQNNWLLCTFFLSFDVIIYINLITSHKKFTFFYCWNYIFKHFVISYFVQKYYFILKFAILIIETHFAKKYFKGL